MLFINRLLMVGLLSVGLAAATTAQAGNQLFEGTWTLKAFGNECAKSATGQPQCVQPPESRTGDSEYYSAWGIPGGVQCNENQPRCPFQSTPTDGMGNWAPLGGTQNGISPHCEVWADWRGKGGTTMRPAKSGTYRTTMFNAVVPPLYRNYQFFTTSTPSAEPNATFCSAISTDGYGGKGAVQAGNPAAGNWVATTTGTQLGGFNFTSAPTTATVGTAQGLRATAVAGQFEATYPYVYSYTYAEVRNDQGVFGPGKGAGNFNIPFGSPQVASVNVKQGAARFGGTMRMLGILTSKVCYYRLGGCSLGQNDWRYDAIGATAYTTGGTPNAPGVVTAGYLATFKGYYYHTKLMQQSTVSVEGERFPWTTGSVTLTATGRGPHKTVHYTQGFDNRNTTTPSGKGTIKLVTPVLTRWLQPCCKFETGGVASLRIKFVPEPQTWAMLLAGASLLGVGYRMRGR